MWGRSKADEIAKTTAVIRNRYATVLGLDLEEHPDGRSQDHSLGLEDHNEPTTQSKSQAIAEFFPTAGVVLAGASAPDAALTQLTEKSGELLDTQAKLFEKTVAQIANQNPAQAEERVRETLSRLEAYLAQADEMKLTMDENLASLAKHTTEAAQLQSKALEENLTQITQQIGSRLQKELAPMASRLEGYRAQADQMYATLETALRSFTQKTEEAAQQQARSFEEKIAHVSEEALSQAQESLHSEITQVRETAAHSFEQQMAALADRLYAERQNLMLAELERTSEELSGQLGKQIEQRCEQSLQEALQALQDRLLTESTRLETSETPVSGNSAAPPQENFEAWSKAQLAAIQQQAGDLSTHLLDQVRAESQAIAQQLQDRLKTDTQFLETRIVETLQGKLQTLTDEFRLLTERAFARNCSTRAICSSGAGLTVSPPARIF